MTFYCCERGVIVNCWFSEVISWEGYDFGVDGGFGDCFDYGTMVAGCGA